MRRRPGSARLIQNPAHAGMNLVISYVKRIELAKPRSRGDEPFMHSEIQELADKTPLTRG